MKKVLVTGGAGFVGAHLVKKLIKKKYKVMIVDLIEKKVMLKCSKIKCIQRRI